MKWRCRVAIRSPWEDSHLQYVAITRRQTEYMPKALMDALQWTDDPWTGGGAPFGLRWEYYLARVSR